MTLASRILTPGQLLEMGCLKCDHTVYRNPLCIPFADDQNFCRLAVGDLCKYLDPKLKRLDVVSEAQPANIVIVWSEPTSGDLVEEPDVLTIDHQD